MSKKLKRFYKKELIKEKRVSNKSEQVRFSTQSLKKEKNKEIKITYQESPKNNRFITEIKKPKILFLTCISIVSIIGIIWLYNLVNNQYISFEKVDVSRKNLEIKLNQLYQNALEHPGSRDIYLQLANVSYQMGNLSDSIKFTQRALSLDPNYRLALDLNKKLKEIK